VKLDFKKTKSKFDSKIFENSRSNLITKLANYPERYTGIFRSTQPNDKLIQNVSQSHEINFGDAMEFLIEDVFCLYQYTSLDRKYTLSNGDTLSYDQLFSLDNKIIFIEQKVRDDHDSTKKRGQVENFVKKIRHLIDLGYPKENITSYIYFIDEAFKKNKKYYSDELDQLSSEGFDCKLVYGEELFIEENIQHAWSDEIIAFLNLWREDLPGTPELNFDIDPEFTFNELKKLKINLVIKLLKNKDVINTYFPLIFPEKSSLQLLLMDYRNRISDEHTAASDKKKCVELISLIEKAISSY
tara:strand:- start:843 stop:1739 length:897 start_codon:yes stop_codon:yes gene_type:complete